MPQRRKRKLTQKTDCSSKRPKVSSENNSLKSCIPDDGRRTSQRFKAINVIASTECKKSVKKKKRNANKKIDQQTRNRNGAVNGTIDGAINGAINGTVNATVSATINGTVNGALNATVNSISKKKVKKKLESELKDTESNGGVLQSHDAFKTALEKAVDSCDNFGVNKILESSKTNDFCCRKILDAALVKACSKGMLPSVYALLECGARLNKRDAELRTPLTAAVEHGYLDLVRVLLEKGADVNLSSSNDDTALMIAIRKGFSILLVMDLIRMGADVNARNKSGKTAAMTAVEKYDLKALIVLVSHGARLDVSDSCWKTLFDSAPEQNLLEMLRLLIESKSDVASLLNKVIQNNRIDILRHFINSGISLLYSPPRNYNEYSLALKDSNCRNIDKGTDGPEVPQEAGLNITSPLCLAAASGNVEIVKMLIGAGFSVNVMESGNGMTAAMFAAHGGHGEIIKVLHKHGANINAVGELGYTALTYAIKADKIQCAQILLKLGAVINAKLDFCMAATQNQMKYLRLLSHQVSISDLDPEVLLAAVSASNYKAVKFLTDKGMDVNAAGQSALLQSKDKKINNLLIKKGATVNNFSELLSEDNDDDDFDNSKAEMIKLLIKMGHQVKDKDSLINATHRNTPHIVQILLKAGADPDVMTPTGETALMIAAQHNYTEIMDLLLKNGAWVDKQAQDGFSALMYAAMNSCQDAVQVLLGRRANVNLESDKGDTALLLTTDVDIVKLLVDAGAEVNVKNKAGLTPLQFSKETERLSLQQVLESLGAKDNVWVDEKGDVTSVEVADFHPCVENQTFVVESRALENV
ncbi:hypothetical protein Btru_013366 [Bulinus truncatus]|nr:hypothetical protein Btru_013366 [Bulinus truncatus]